MTDENREFSNLKGILGWIDHIVGGYFGLAAVLVMLWFTIVFPLALIWWAWPHVQSFFAWLSGLVG
ncbi:MAG: hypothetical protein U5L08_07920 [Xanthomonadales bacterium]|nr:hypothetical protein [Xanthomonadales bacterium]